MEKVYTIKKKFTKYFGELWDEVKSKIKNWKDYHILLFLGGKNRGKSYSAFQMFYDEIKKGNKVVYLRNSAQELDKIKNVIAGEVARIKGEPVKVNHDGVFLKSNNEIIVLFASSKNYNNLSGNTISYSLVFYDEYNQILTTDMLMLLENFLLSMNTLFRTNPFKIVVCGNTKTKNNLFFNLYKIDAKLIPDTTTVTLWNDYLLCVRYDDDVFLEPLGNKKDMEIIKLTNPELYAQMFRGLNYGYEDELIINNVNFETWTPYNLYVLFENRIYRLFKKVIFLNGSRQEIWGVFFIKYFIENDFKKGDEVYTNSLKYNYLFNFPLFEKQENLILKWVKKLQSKSLFFNDFIFYTYFTENKFIFSVSMWKNVI